jgi:hypothetical protein
LKPARTFSAETSLGTEQILLMAINIRLMNVKLKKLEEKLRELERQLSQPS